MSKQLKLIKNLITVSNRVKCTWCEHGNDPGVGTAGICRSCHSQFKQLLRSRRWAKHRQLLLLDKPTCADPFHRHLIPNQRPMAMIADHIIPWVFMPSLFWDDDNIQGLCHDCDYDKRQIDGSMTRSPNSQWGNG